MEDLNEREAARPSPKEMKDVVADLPHCVYFYYLTPNDNAGPNIKAFLYERPKPILPTEIETIIIQLAQSAAAGSMQPVGWALGDLRWRRRSYIAMVLHDPSRDFKDAEGLSITDGSKAFEKKHWLEFSLLSGEQVQAIYVLNEIKDKNGNTCGRDDRVSFGLELKPYPSYMHRNHEDTGQNMGPPIGPP